MHADQDTLPDNYRYFSEQITRWDDNDIYGHINNVRYYSFFDSACNRFLIERGQLDIHQDNIVGFVVASNCQYLQPVAYPQNLTVGLRSNKISNRSVQYGVALFFSETPLKTAVAYGTFTHVFIDQRSQQAVSIPASIKTALEAIKTINTA